MTDTTNFSDRMWWSDSDKPATPGNIWGPLFGQYEPRSTPRYQIGEGQFFDFGTLGAYQDQVAKHEESPSTDSTAPSDEDVPRSPPHFPYPTQDAPCTDTDEWQVAESVWERYVADPPKEESGMTLMCHDLLNKFKVEPDLLNIFEQLGVLEFVDYIYLPLTYLKSGTAGKVQKACRNKGYCFVHFSTNEAADLFSSKVNQMVLPGTSSPSGKRMHSTPAKFQGIASNLTELLDLKSGHWRAKTGYFYIRSGLKLEAVALSVLRSFCESEPEWA